MTSRVCSLTSSSELWLNLTVKQLVEMSFNCLPACRFIAKLQTMTACLSAPDSLVKKHRKGKKGKKKKKQKRQEEEGKKVRRRWEKEAET